jgi:hypothetical protein
MQQRRYRPGDVLDDYCPRERRITDHAIVAMIDDDIKQTRCVVCDAEHEYKDGKIPAQRRKKPQAALFSQVLEGLQGPQPSARLSPQQDSEPDGDTQSVNERAPDTVEPVVSAPAAAQAERAVYAAAEPPPTPVSDDAFPDEASVRRDDGPWRRQLIRAALPRPEGQQPQPTRQMPEFTVRQPTARAHRHGGRRGGGQGPGNSQGPMRFGRDGRDGQGNGGGQRQHNGRRRRRGKKQSS